MKPPRPLVFLLFPCLVALPPGAAIAQAPPSTTPPPAVLPLDDALALALRSNPELAIARHERNVGLIGADRARPGLRPEVTATASQIVRGPRVDLPGKPDDVVLPNSISRLELGLRQPVFQFGAGDAPSKRANAMAAAARSDYRKAELNTVQEVREAYLTVARTRALAEITGKGVELARANVQQTQLLVERGFQAQVDVLDAERALAEAEAQELQARNGVDLARANVNRLLGRAIDTPFRIAGSGPLPGDPAALDELAAQAMRQRPEAETLRQQIEAAEAGIRLARAARQPRVTLDLAYALQTETALVPKSGVAAGVSVSVPIFSGAAQRYTVREAEERVAQLKSSLTALEQGISLEIQQQRLAIQEARARITASQRAVTAAEQAYEITQARLERGRAVQLEILNARLNLQRARGSVAEAEGDLRLADARLQRALGLGPSLETGK
jgi:outer membrane protein TolC